MTNNKPPFYHTQEIDVEHPLSHAISILCSWISNIASNLQHSERQKMLDEFEKAIQLLRDSK
jgi:hypothetical protein